jgi:hypothetical protein
LAERQKGMRLNFVIDENSVSTHARKLDIRVAQVDIPPLENKAPSA